MRGSPSSSAGNGGGERKGSTMPELMAGVVTSRAGVDTG